MTRFGVNFWLAPALNIHRDIRFAEKKGGKYRIAHVAETVAAGGDLFMPGGKSDYEDLSKAMKEESALREQARINASRVYRMIQLLKAREE